MLQNIQRRRDGEWGTEILRRWKLSFPRSIILFLNAYSMRCVAKVNCWKNLNIYNKICLILGKDCVFVRTKQQQHHRMPNINRGERSFLITLHHLTAEQLCSSVAQNRHTIIIKWGGGQWIPGSWVGATPNKSSGRIYWFPVCLLVSGRRDEEEEEEDTKAN